MSADAKVWRDGEMWYGINDVDFMEKPYCAYSLSEVLQHCEQRLEAAHGIRWEFREYPDNAPGLSGYVV